MLKLQLFIICFEGIQLCSYLVQILLPLTLLFVFGLFQLIREVLLVFIELLHFLKHLFTIVLNLLF